jgi:hypothetical protein
MTDGTEASAATANGDNFARDIKGKRQAGSKRGAKKRPEAARAMLFKWPRTAAPVTPVSVAIERRERR